MKQRALFLDRDGVINIDHGYPHRPEHIDFIDGIFELSQKANSLGYLIFVITNQAGIARGYYSEQDFLNVTDWIHQQFLKHGARIEQTYFCPFHPEHGIGIYKQESALRKPNPGMILKASQDHHLNLKQSLLVGDKESDIQAGLKAGVGHNILYLPLEKKQSTSQDIHIIHHLKEASYYLST